MISRIPRFIVPNLIFGQKYDYAIVRERTSKAFTLPSVNIRFQSPTGEAFYITNDEQLHKALKAAEKGGAKFIEVKVFKDAGGAPAAASSAPRQTTAPASTAAAPAASRPAAAPASSHPVAAGAGTLASYKLTGDAKSASDRVIVEPQQASDHFLFNVKPSKYDTDVVVELKGTALNFLTTHTVPEGASYKTIKGTQGISLPFAPNASQLQVSGHQIKIFFPKN